MSKEDNRAAFEPPINPDTGRPYNESSKTYKEAYEQYLAEAIPDTPAEAIVEKSEERAEPTSDTPEVDSLIESAIEKYKEGEQERIDKAVAEAVAKVRAEYEAKEDERIDEAVAEAVAKVRAEYEAKEDEPKEEKIELTSKEKNSIDEIAEELFRAGKYNEFYFTSDLIPFAKKADARVHSLTLDNKLIIHKVKEK